jgi:hypothetical protein
VAQLHDGYMMMMVMMMTIMEEAVLKTAQLIIAYFLTS